MRFIATLLLLMMAFTLVIPASAQDAPGTILESTFRTSTSVDQATELILDFYPDTNFVEARYAVDEYRIRMLTSNVDGTPIETVAQLYIPRATQPLSFPVYVFGAGTTGLVNQCAPSLEQPEVSDWGRYRQYLISYASQGYITIMADYAGFHTEGMLQPYYVSEMQGRVALDAARAAFNAYENNLIDPANGQPFNAVFVGGYSQGGQTVFAARDIASRYAPDVPLAGILAFGSVTDQINHMITRPEFAAYRWVAWESFYGPERVDYSPIFSDLFLPTVVNDATTMCVREAFNFYSSNPRDVYRPAFADALLNGTLEQDFPAIYELLVENSPGFTAGDVPSLVLQGDQDATISPAKMAEFVDQYCAIDGNVLTYQEYLSTTHFNTREVSYRDTLNWMATVLSGEAVRNDCGS